MDRAGPESHVANSQPISASLSEIYQTRAITVASGLRARHGPSRAGPGRCSCLPGDINLPNYVHA